MYVGMRIIPVGKCLPGGGEHQSFCRCDRGVRAHQGVPSSDDKFSGSAVVVLP